MSDAAKRELHELIRAAVAEAIQAHPCRFTVDEAAALHAIAKLTSDQLTALSLFSRAVNAAASRFATLAVWAVIGAIVAALAWGVRCGFLRAE